MLKSLPFRSEKIHSQVGSPSAFVWLILALAVLCVLPARAQTNPPPASYVRSYVNDLPDQPLVTVTVTGASNVSCFTIEEDLPGPATPVSVSGDGVWLPSIGAIRWGPFFNTIATNVSYRLTGPAGSYPVNGGAWMDGEWNFSPGVTMVTVLPPGDGGVLSAPAMPPQAAMPTFAPASGASVPANVTISCTTTGAVIYYTLDGTLPTTNSLPYTNAIYLASANTVRAAAIPNGWTSSLAAVAYYGPAAATANAQVTRSVDMSSPTAPVVTFNVTPGTNATCIAVTESLPPGVAATSITAGGNYIVSNNAVVWGPFFGTNAQTLSYQAVGQPGTYSVQAAWSVDGVGGSETSATSLIVASTSSNSVPIAPSQVAAPVFTPASGSDVPVNVAISSATPGATIYYTLDGSLPTRGSTLYNGLIYLASTSIIRAVAFTNGWTPSMAGVAYYGPPAAPVNAQVTRNVDTSSSPDAPVVTFSVTPGLGASCVAVTESLPPGVAATSVTAGGNYIASNNVVLWGPFFGTNAQVLSYVAVGLPGTYPVQATWSVDGVNNGEMTATNLVIVGSTGGTIPTPPQQVPTPVLTPSIASNLPVTVSISCSDSQAQIYYTTDGALPTQNSTRYTAPLSFGVKTSLRTVAFHAGYLPSTAVVGEYVPVLTTNTVLLAQSVSGDGSFLPTVSLTATPQRTVDCYAVVETIPFGLTPSGLSGDGIWDPIASEIRWGPYLDNQPRVFSYNVDGASGIYNLSGQVSFNGYSTGTMASVQVDANYSGSAPITNLVACATDYLTYNLNINPAPGVVTVTSATGTVDWGDGTQSAITQPNMTFEKSYSVSGPYSIAFSANWTGYTAATAVSGVATRTDLVQVVTTCDAPQIVTQPSNQVVLAGSTAQFTVSAASAFPMIYQWHFNTNAQVFSPSDFATLTLPNVTPQSAGLYSVVITNAFGSATSSVATLTVVIPSITSATRSADGRVSLNFVGLPDTTTRVWATTNLLSPTSWQPIFTNNTTGADGTWQFIDTNAAGFPVRFYRFSTP